MDVGSTKAEHGQTKTKGKKIKMLLEYRLSEKSKKKTTIAPNYRAMNGRRRSDKKKKKHFSLKRKSRDMYQIN